MERHGRLGDTWYLDEVFIKIRGVLHYLWRAVDQGGDTIDILVQKRRNKAAAKRLFRKLLKRTSRHGVANDYRQTEELFGSALRGVAFGSTEQYDNNRVEVSDEPTRQRERQMRRFESAGQAQRFLNGLWRGRQSVQTGSALDASDSLSRASFEGFL